MSTNFPGRATANRSESTAARPLTLPTFSQRLRNPLWLILAVSFWIGLLANLPLWRELAALSLINTLTGWAFAAALAFMVTAVLTIFLSLLAWKFLLKPIAILLLLSAALGAYFMLTYHVVIDPTMMTNVLQTDMHEARGLLSPRLIGTLLLLGVLPAGIVWRWRLDYGRWTVRFAQNLLLTVVAAATLTAVAIASFAPLSSTMRNHKHLRYLFNPLNSIYAVSYLATKSLRNDESSLEPLGLDAHLSPRPLVSKPPLLVLVLGETGRSGNFGINGYGRATTPELVRQKVASFRNAWSCGTSTAASVPCMFSPLGREEFNASTHHAENLLDVVQRAGLAVLWLDNQSGCKSVCDRVPQASTAELHDPLLCANDACFDEIMLKGLEQRVSELSADRRNHGVVIVLHQMGSHGPAYHQRSPQAFKPFKPECLSNELQDCKTAELINAYDNSIVYTDHFLSLTIGWLKRQEANFAPAMVYVADHGESLGENNLYLHGMPYMLAPDVQKHVPWITWLSGGFEARTGLTTDCLQKQADARVSHDNYFHSVLGMLRIETTAYKPQLDAYAQCEAMHNARVNPPPLASVRPFKRGA